MKRIVLVRHGETVWHAENRYAGSSDIALTPRGLQQAEELARWAVGAGLSGIWASSLSRAQATAQPACVATGLALRTDARLRELHFGRGEGMTDSDMQDAFPELRQAFLQNPAKNFLPEGEDPQAAADRGQQALQDVASALEPGQRALVVAHNTLIRLLVCRSLGIPLSRYRTVFPKLANATCTELGVSHGGIALLSFNAPLTFNEKGTR